TLKALGIEAFYLRKLDNLANKEVETHYLLDQIQGHKNRLLNISRQYILIITVSIGCLLVMQNKITLGALVICVLLSDSSLYLLHRWIEWFNQSQRQKSMMNHLQGLYSLPQEHEMIINSKDIESQIDLVSV